jgi:hypothetical protein
MNAELTPWWVAIATGVVTCLAGVVGKLWSDQRREAATAAAVAADENRELRAQLVAANARSTEDVQRSTEEHVRDLRRIAGLAGATASWPPPVINRRAKRG